MFNLFKKKTETPRERIGLEMTASELFENIDTMKPRMAEILERWEAHIEEGFIVEVMPEPDQAIWAFVRAVEWEHDPEHHYIHRPGAEPVLQNKLMVTVTTLPVDGSEGDTLKLDHTWIIQAMSRGEIEALDPDVPIALTGGNPYLEALNTNPALTWSGPYQREG
jgi:hypothetical protein